MIDYILSTEYEDFAQCEIRRVARQLYDLLDVAPVRVHAECRERVMEILGSLKSRPPSALRDAALKEAEWWDRLTPGARQLNVAGASVSRYRVRNRGRQPCLSGWEPSQPLSRKRNGHQRAQPQWDREGG